MNLTHIHPSTDVAVVVPRVTVVIPARNAARTLEATLRSVQAQHVMDWEAIVVDDGSSDDTRRIAEKVARYDPRVRVVSGPVRGVSAARNAGIAQARSAYVAFLDADDLWRPAKLGTHLAFMRQHPQVGLSFDRVLFVDPQARPTQVTSTRRVQGLRPHDFLYENPACTASTLFARTAVLRQLGGFHEQVHQSEDLELMLRVACLSGWKVEGMDRVLTHYRASEQGASAGLRAMELGWERLMDVASIYAAELVARHRRAARAVHLRYLARRALRLDQSPRVGLAFLLQALKASPLALLREPYRTFGTALGLLCAAFARPALRRLA